MANFHFFCFVLFLQTRISTTVKMKSTILAITFGLVMTAALCAAVQYRSGGGCWRGACWKWCGNDLDITESGQEGSCHF